MSRLFASANPTAESDKEYEMKKITGALAILLVVYLGVYILLSANGEYETTNLFKGQVKWQPKGVKFRRVKPFRKDPVIEANFGGYLFLPLICIDRTVWHRDKTLGDHWIDGGG
jgi:hypothetical protein